jgi:hypothetical protein
VTENFFKEKLKEEMMNETSIQSSENLSYSQLFQQKSFIRLLDDEKSSFSESKYNFLPNIQGNFKPKSTNKIDYYNKSDSNIILINKESSENTSKNERNTSNSYKNKTNKKILGVNDYESQYNIDDFINIENQKVNDSRDIADSDNVISLLERDLDDDLLIIDEEVYDEKLKSVIFIVLF